MSPGSATNAGIEYQQRVSAWFLIFMLLEIEISEFFDLPANLQVSEVAFETNTPIDDLRVSFQNGQSAFLQIKRSLNLSTSPSSDFYKTINQFIEEYIQHPESTDYFVIATPSNSSSKIIRELRKILESIRLNKDGFQRNPLNKSESDTLSSYTELVQTLFHQKTKTEISNEIFLEFSAKVFVSIFDISDGHPLEKAAILLLKDKSRVNPKLLWAVMIKNCLHYAAERLSIDRNGLKLAIGEYIEEIQNKILLESENNKRLFSTLFEGEISSKRELLLIESFLGDGNYMIVELFRFNDDCTKQLRFFDNNKCETTSGMVWNVLYRAATYAGLERFAEKIKSDLGDSEILIIPANSNDDEDNTCAHIYSELCREILEQQEKISYCLHCGKALTEVNSIFIEIDDDNHEHLIGSIHSGCLRPIDRILGIQRNEFYEKYSFLNKFNIEKWASLIQHGQGVFNSIYNNQSLKNRIIILGWTPTVEYAPTYNYCVKIYLENDEIRYLTTRGKVERMIHAEALSTVEYMNENFERNRVKQDPFCYTSKNNSFGPYSFLATIKADDETCLECISAELTRYESMIGKIYNQNNDFYAPICLLVDENSEEVFLINNHVVFITDPFVLNDFLDNWEKAGISPKPYEIQIINHDQDFDARVQAFLKSSVDIIIDPILDNTGKFIQGIVIENLHQIIPESHLHLK